MVRIDDEGVVFVHLYCPTMSMNGSFPGRNWHIEECILLTQEESKKLIVEHNQTCEYNHIMPIGGGNIESDPVHGKVYFSIGEGRGQSS